ncbi:MAG: RDD family protein [Candidatus Kapabacteria bacterium]|nr:RDD family protein [Candidatus Kapabacteria bacterium]MBP7092413.1 RDD family protein [Candidatus Kapabacteria bacterium]
MQQPDYSSNPFGAPSTPPIEYIRIGFGKRLVAFLIDGLISLTVMLGIGLLLMAMEVQVGGPIQEQINEVLSIYDMIGIDSGIQDLVQSMMGGLILASLVVSVCYPLIEGITGASPGKRILRIVVAHQDGRAGNIALFLKRYGIKNLSALLQVVALLPALGFFEGIGSFASVVIFFGCFAALSTARLALHDLIAQTAVFDTQDVH